MTPDPATDSKAQSAQGSEIAMLWRRYLACRDNRTHDQLLRAVDRFIRVEVKRLLVSHSYHAEEAAQEALLGVERKILSLEAPEYPAAFIRKVLSNKIATILQRESRRKAREERNWSPELPDENISTSTEWHEFLGTLRTAVNDDEFWTLVLHYHFDFSYDEIGELLEKEAGTIRQIALRGRRKCRQRLSRLEGRVPAWFGLPDSESDGGWELLDPDEVAEQQQLADAEAGRGPAQLDSTPQPSGEQPEITARKAGEWGQDISDSADGLRRASIGSETTAPIEPGTNTRRFGRLKVHAGTATSRLERIGRRWLITAPSSVLPLVALVAVPAFLFPTNVEASIVVEPATISSEPTGPTVATTAPEGGGSAGADRAGREGLVERPIDQPPTGPAQPADRTDQIDTTATTTANGVGADGATTPSGQGLFFDLVVVPNGPALPVPTDQTTLPSTLPSANETIEPPAAGSSPTTAAATVTTGPTPTVGTTTTTRPSIPQTTKRQATTTATPTTLGTTTTVASAVTTVRTTTTTTSATTTTTATTTALTTTAQTTTTAAETTSTAAVTTSPTTTTTTGRPTTTEQTTTTAQTTTTEQATTTTAAASTTTTAATTTTTTTAQTTTTLPPPTVGPMSLAF